jgi:hypothetical protein
MKRRLTKCIEVWQGEKQSFLIGHLTFFICHFEERLGLCWFFVIGAVIENPVLPLCLWVTNQQLLVFVAKLLQNQEQKRCTPEEIHEIKNFP